MESNNMSKIGTDSTKVTYEFEENQKILRVRNPKSERKHYEKKKRETRKWYIKKYSNIREFWQDLMSKIKTLEEIIDKKHELGIKSNLELKDMGIKKMLERLRVLYIALIQATNGVRASEAIGAFEFLVENYEKLLYNKENRKIVLEAQKSYELRPLVFIDYFFRGLATKIIPLIRSMGIQKVSQTNYSTMIKKEFGINTHTIRYMFEDLLNEKGLSPLDIMKMMGWKTLERVQHYSDAVRTEEKAMELKKEFDEIFGS